MIRISPRQGLVIFFFCFSFLYNWSISHSLDYNAVIKGRNVWFQSDARRYYRGMTDRFADHERSSVHPLFPIVTYLPVIVAMKVGLTKSSAVILLYSLLAGVWASLLYWILSYFSSSVFDAFCFTMLGLFSSSFLFLSILPETYLLGSVSLLICFLVHLKAKSYLLYIISLLLGLSITITNGMASVISTFIRWEVKRSFSIIVVAFFILSGLVLAQKIVFTSSGTFLNIFEERKWLFVEEAGGFSDKTRVFFLYSMISPVIDVLFNKYSPEWPLVTMQMVKIRPSIDLLNCLILGWIILLGRGLYYCFKNVKENSFLLLFLLYQFVLHLVYGDETFLYSLHWLPFLIVLSIQNSKMNHWKFVRIPFLIFTCFVVFNNLRAFDSVWGLVVNYN